MGWKFSSFLFSLSFFFHACILDSSKPIEPLIFLHDNSSKVWQIEHCTNNGIDYVPISRELKDIVTFYVSGFAYFQRMGTFGNEKGEKAKVTLDVKKRIISFRFEKVKWKFQIISDDINTLVLQSINKKDFPYDLVLIPLSEPS